MAEVAIPFAKAVLLSETGRLLIQRRTKPGDLYSGFWELPGGRIERGEGLLQALEREVREETGIPLVTWLGQPTTTETDRFGGEARLLIPLVTVEVAGKSAPIHGQYFAGRVSDTAAETMETAEAGEHRWISWSQLRREFLVVDSESRNLTTVDALALRIALEGPLLPWVTEPE